MYLSISHPWYFKQANWNGPVVTDRKSSMGSWSISIRIRYGSFSPIKHAIYSSYFEPKPHSDVENGPLDLWPKVIKILEDHYNISIRTTTTFNNLQSEATVDTIKNHLLSLDEFSLVAIETQTRLFKSVLLALALNRNLITLPMALDCALAESDSQSHRWGCITETHSLNRALMGRNAALATLLSCKTD